MKHESIKRIAPFLIGAFVLVVCVRYIVASFQWGAIFPILATADLRYLVGVEAITIVLYWLLRAWRWSILLRNLDVHISFVDLYMSTAVSLGFANYTPFQSGEMLKVELLKKYGKLQRFHGYSAFAVERLIDLFVVVSMAAVGILTKLDLGINPSSVLLIWIVLFFSLPVGFAIIRKIKLGGRVGEFLRDTLSCIDNPRTLLMAVLLTFGSWTMVSIAYQVLLYSISINIGLQDVISLTSIITLINILSVVPGSIGVSEAGNAEILIRLGQDLTHAQAGALVLRGHSLVAIGLGMLHFAFWRVSKNRQAEILKGESEAMVPANQNRLDADGKVQRL